MGLSRQGRMSGKRKYETGQRCGLFWCCEAPWHACAVATAQGRPVLYFIFYLCKVERLHPCPPVIPAASSTACHLLQHNQARHAHSSQASWADNLCSIHKADRGAGAHAVSAFRR